MATTPNPQQQQRQVAPPPPPDDSAKDQQTVKVTTLPALLQYLKISPALYASVMAEDEEDGATIPFEDTNMTLEVDGRYYEQVENTPPDVVIFVHHANYRANSCIELWAKLGGWIKEARELKDEAPGCVIVVSSDGESSKVTLRQEQLFDDDTATATPPPSLEETKEEENTDKTKSVAVPHLRICVLTDHVAAATLPMPDPDTLRLICTRILAENGLLVSHQFYAPAGMPLPMVREFRRFYACYDQAFRSNLARHKDAICEQLNAFTSSSESSYNSELSYSSNSESGGGCDDGEEAASPGTHGIFDDPVDGGKVIGQDQDAHSSTSSLSSSSSLPSHGSAEEVEYRNLVQQLEALDRIDPLAHLRLTAAIYAPTFVTPSVSVCMVSRGVAMLAEDGATNTKQTYRIAVNVMQVMRDMRARIPASAAMYFVELERTLVYNEYHSAKILTPSSSREGEEEEEEESTTTSRSTAAAAAAAPSVEK